MSDVRMTHTQQTDEDILKNFLLDIDCLDELSTWTNKFNLFDILKISKTEIRHSNMLAWLLDPNENHNLKDYFIRSLFEKIAKNINTKDVNIFDILLMNYYEFKIQREWKNIDLLIVSDESQIVICIENKVYSSERGDQLERYKDTIEEHYTNYTKLFLFLTPLGEDSSDTDTWINISYSEIITLLEHSVSKTTLLPEVELLIKNYIDTVRWHIVGDDNLIKICNDIYRRHKKALDLIYENKLDNTQEVSSFILKHMVKLQENRTFIVDESKHSKTYIRFTTEIMSKIMPDTPSETSGWKTKNYYFYELVLKNNSIKLQLSIGRGSFTDEERDNYFKDILQVTNSIVPKATWTWKIIKSWNILKYTDEETIDDIKETLIEKIDEILLKVNSFEIDIATKMNK